MRLECVENLRVLDETSRIVGRVDLAKFQIKVMRKFDDSLNESVQLVVTGRPVDRFMESGVQVKKLPVGVGRATHHRFHLPAYVLEFGQGVGSDTGSRKTRAVTLEEGEQIEKFFELRFIDIRHMRPAVGPNRHEPIVHKLLDRLTDWRSAHPKLRREFLLLELAPRRKSPIEDSAADLLVSPLARGRHANFSCRRPQRANRSLFGCRRISVLATQWSCRGTGPPPASPPNYSPQPPPADVENRPPQSLPRSLQ